MSKITYNNTVIADSNNVVTMKTEGKKMLTDVIVEGESDKFPFIIPLNFDSSSPLSGTVAFDSDKSADAMTALRAGRPICVQPVGAETNLALISSMTCLSTADYSDTDPDHWDIIAYARANLFECSGGAVTSLSVIEINLLTNAWTASMKLFN